MTFRYAPVVLATSLALMSCSSQRSAELVPPAFALSVTQTATLPMREAAQKLLNALTDVQRTEIMFALSDTIARTQWSNLPSAMFERDGLRTGNMTETQRILVHDLLRASTSSQGYLKIAGIMWLDDILRENALARGGGGGGGRRARLIESWTTENYWVSVFGDPESDPQWAWLITGHHLAASFTVNGNQVAFTPLFLGAEPYTIENGPYAGWRALSHEVERGFALLQTLDDGQRSVAVLGSDIPRDVLEGPGRRASLARFEGLSASKLGEHQQVLFWYLIEEFVRNAEHDAAENHLEKIRRDGLDQLYFAWIGPVDNISSRYYYRVHGPSILIEYVRERGVGGDQGAANHIHTMVRDPSNDYGEDWLGLHYQEHHRR